MHGTGVMYWPNGRKYEGEFKDDMREGQGKLITEEGKVFNGAWSKGRYMQEDTFIHESDPNDQSLASQFN